MWRRRHTDLLTIIDIATSLYIVSQSILYPESIMAPDDANPGYAELLAPRFLAATSSERIVMGPDWTCSSSTITSLVS